MRDWITDDKSYSHIACSATTAAPSSMPGSPCRRSGVATSSRISPLSKRAHVSGEVVVKMGIETSPQRPRGVTRTVGYSRGPAQPGSSLSPVSLSNLTPPRTHSRFPGRQASIAGELGQGRTGFIYGRTGPHLQLLPSPHFTPDCPDKADNPLSDNCCDPSSLEEQPAKRGGKCHCPVCPGVRLRSAGEAHPPADCGMWSGLIPRTNYECSGQGG